MRKLQQMALVCHADRFGSIYSMKKARWRWPAGLQCTVWGGAGMLGLGQGVLPASRA